LEFEIFFTLPINRYNANISHKKACQDIKPKNFEKRYTFETNIENCFAKFLLESKKVPKHRLLLSMAIDTVLKI